MSGLGLFPDFYQYHKTFLDWCLLTRCHIHTSKHQIQGNPRNMKFTNPSKYRGIKETWNLQIHSNTGESKKHEIYRSIQIQGNQRNMKLKKSIQIQGNQRNMKLTNPSKYRGIKETWNLHIHPNTGELKKHETCKSV